MVPAEFTPWTLLTDLGMIYGLILIGKDTVYHIQLREVYRFSWDKESQKGREWRKFQRLVYNFHKTYPYALKAKRIINEADSVIANSNFSNRERENYIRQHEKELFREFEKPIRKLTPSQGRLLLKLVDREVGLSSHYIIRNYRGRPAAGFWQGVSKIFGYDLKGRYDRYGEDRATEELVEMYHQGSFRYLYYSIFFQ